MASASGYIQNAHAPLNALPIGEPHVQMSDDAQTGCNNPLKAAPGPCYARYVLLVYTAARRMQFVPTPLLVPFARLKHCRSCMTYLTADERPKHRYRVKGKMQ